MMKAVSVSHKLGIAIMIIVLSVLLPLGFIINQAVTNFFISNKQTQLLDLGENLMVTYSSNRPKAFVNRVQEMVSLTQNQAIVLKAPSQFTLNTGHLNFHLRKTDCVALSKGQTIQEQWQSQDHKNFLVVGRPIIQKGQIQGVLLLFSSINRLLASMQDIRTTLYLAGFGALLLAVGFTNFLSKILSRPLIEMEAATKKISEGNLSVRLESKSEDELGRLSQSINQMALSLETIQKKRTELFANIAHELKTPMTYLKGYADVLNKGFVQSEEEKKRYLSIIQEETDRLSLLINDLFDLAVMDEGKMDFHLEPLEINHMLASVCEALEVVVKEKGLELKTSMPADGLWIKADPTRMTQVLTNLLHNAVRYTDKGDIQVRLFSMNEKVMIEIEDTGVGMSDDDLKQIFERFYRADKSRSRQTGGMGIGLAIVKELIDQQKGTIRVKSAEGKGTLFILAFPQIQGRITD